MDKRLVELRNNKPENRSTRYTADELRAEERKGADDKPRLFISGYAARYGQRSGDLGGFTEIIEPGAFDHILAGDPDVRCLYNHGSSFVLGRTKSGTLKLTSDKRGLKMECELPNTAQARGVFESIKRGDVSGQSFAFSMHPDGEDEWSPDFSERRIKRVAALYDVGPVTFPAYPSADVGAAVRAQATGATQAAKGTSGKTPRKTENPMNWVEIMKRAAEKTQAAEATKTDAEAESRALTTDEVAKINALLGEGDELRSQAETLKRLEEASAKATAPETRKTEPPVPQAQQNRIQIMGAATSRHYLPSMFGSVEKAKEAAYRAGRWAMATLLRHEASRAWCREHGVEMRAQSENVNTAGGYLVPTEMETSIIKLIEEHGVTRANARISSMGSDTKTQPVQVGDLTAYPVGEGQEIPESDASWDNIGLVAKKWAVRVRFSSELREDAAVQLADELTESAARAFARAEDAALFTGDGTSAFNGVKGILESLQAGSIKNAETGNTSFAKITDGDITAALAALPEYAQAGAKIYCSRVVYGAVISRLLRTPGGTTPSDLAAKQALQYNGLPIVLTSFMPSTDGSGKATLLIGDMNYTALFGDRRAFTMRTSDDRYIELDQSVLVATERFDINVWNAGTASEAGAMILLKTK